MESKLTNNKTSTEVIACDDQLDAEHGGTVDNSTLRLVIDYSCFFRGTLVKHRYSRRGYWINACNGYMKSKPQK
jgi:hypothetical protein